MINQDDVQYATVLSERTLAFLTNHNIAPTPMNYSVIYLYSSNQNKALKADILKQMSDKSPVDGIFLEHLFNRYISNNEKIEQAILIPFESTLKRALSQINDQVVNEKETAKNLDIADKALSKMVDHKPLHKVVNFLLSSIHTSKSQHKSLADELTKTSEEVSFLRKQLAASKQEAIIDALTGLFNRRGCENMLKDFDTSDLHSSIIIDIDHFKAVNDNFGHSIGDKVIQKIASIIKKHIGSEDIPVRYGGEEFVVVMKNKSQENAHFISEKIRTSVQELKLIQRQSNTYLPPMSVSIGIAELEESDDWPSLFERADKALYQAKNSGRNRCVIAEPVADCV